VSEGSYSLDEVETLLVVVERDGRPILQTLRSVLLLLEHEYVVVEVLLEGLVGEVDAQLLEAVLLLMRARSMLVTLTKQVKCVNERERP
jgi:hypothetical protein